MAVIEALVTERDHSPRNPSRGEPPKIFPRVMHFHRGIIYEAYRVTPENREYLRNLVYPFEEQFGYPSTFLLHQKVIKYIQDGAEVVRAVKPRTFFRSARTVGVITQDIKRVNVGAERWKVLSRGIRVVLPGFRRQGIGTHLSDEGIVRHDPEIVTADTRVYSIIDMYQRSGFIRAVAPFDTELTDEMREALRGILDKTTRIDLETGLRYKIFPPSDYSKGDLERFIPPKKNQRGVANYKRMLEIGADPLAGSAIRYAALGDHAAVQAARDRGWFAAQQLFKYTTESALREVTRKVTSRVANLWRSRLGRPS